MLSLSVSRSYLRLRFCGNRFNNKQPRHFFVNSLQRKIKANTTWVALTLLYGSMRLAWISLPACSGDNPPRTRHADGSSLVIVAGTIYNICNPLVSDSIPIQKIIMRTKVRQGQTIVFWTSINLGACAHACEGARPYSMRATNIVQSNFTCAFCGDRFS